MTELDRKEFILMQSDVAYTKDKLTKVHTKVESINDEFKKLSFHLIGDVDTDTKGWIYKLGRFNYRLTLVEKSIAVFAGLFTASTVYLIFVKNVFHFF